MNHPKLIAGGLLAIVVIGCSLMLFSDRRPSLQSGQADALIVYCAAGIKPPVAAAARAYEEEFGIPIELQFGGSGTLLANLQVGVGDLYVAADSSYIDIAKEKELVAESIPAARLTAGVGVAAGNPTDIRSLEQLTNPTVRLALANPDAASVGKLTRDVLGKHGKWEQISAHAIVTKPTVTEVANDIKLGVVDAGIIWDATANQYPEIDFVHIPEFDTASKTITLGVLRSSTRPTAALHFARYLTARDRGLTHFATHNYVPVDGDIWADKPELLFFSGSMLRPAIEDAIRTFEEREGCQINTVFNGCGILVAQMKAGEKPDAYFSCDVKFMDVVAQDFFESALVSSNEMVILVAKGNPHGIHHLSDLGRPDIRLGLCHPDKSALGYLTRWLLQKEGIYQAVLANENRIPYSATGDFLINQMRTQSLDAAIVYRSNAMATPATLNECDIVSIDADGALAKQPYAIGRNTEHRHLMQRFFDAMVTAEGQRQRFLSYGFSWELADPQ